MKKQAENWLEAAYDDLKTIKKIQEDESLTNVMAFHAEQAIEKTLKAVLEEYESKVPKVHNVIKLKELTEKYIELEIDRDLLTQINEIYIETRYPSDLGLIPTGKPTIETARIYTNFAENIYNIVKKKMIKGYPV